MREILELGLATTALYVTWKIITKGCVISIEFGSNSNKQRNLCQNKDRNRRN